MYAASFAQKGVYAVQAQQQARQALNFNQKQTSLLTYAQTFQYLSGFFLLCIPLCIPLIFFIRLKRVKPGEKVDMAAH